MANFQIDIEIAEEIELLVVVAASTQDEAERIAKQHGDNWGEQNGYPEGTAGLCVWGQVSETPEGYTAL